jgi:O-antigen biosynthesis protein
LDKKISKTSIIIPFRDKVSLLDACLKSILNKTKGDYEIILVDNNSREKGTQKYLDALSEKSLARVINYKNVFNFSAMNNLAAETAEGEYLLFLNNDTEVISQDWIGEMIKHITKPMVGAVGAKLLYPDGTIQHAGVILGENIATHQFIGVKDESLSHNFTREVDAVTGACLMTKKSLFSKLGGFDEKNLSVAYNDIDYCLRLKKEGFVTLWTPFSKLYHHESATRNSDIYRNLFQKLKCFKRYRQFCKEQAFMKERWSEEIAEGIKRQQL